MYMCIAVYECVVFVCVCTEWMCVVCVHVYDVREGGNNRLFKKRKKFNKLDNNGNREAIKELAVLMSRRQGFVT